MKLLEPSSNEWFSKYEIDYLLLRVNSEQKAREWLALLLNYGSVLSDNSVNGRVIYLIALTQPLYLAGQAIDVVKLPSERCMFYNT